MSAAIITYPLDGVEYDAADAATHFSTRTSGIYAAEEDFAVTPAGGYSVQVSAGLAWVRPSRFAGYSIAKKEADTLTLPLADATRPRIDRIVLRFDGVARTSSLQVLTGTPGSVPLAPALTRTALLYELCLAEVARPAGSTSITAGQITDTRLDEALCGVMRDGVTGIPTAELLAAAKARIAELEQTASDSAGEAAESAAAAAKSAGAAAQSEQTAKEKAAEAAESARTAAETVAAAAEQTVAATTRSAEEAAESAAAAQTHESGAEQSAKNAAASAEGIALSEAAAAQSAASAAQSEQTAKEYLELVKTISTGAQGWYPDPDALGQAVPIGSDGWWAVIGSTDSIWTWDSDTGAWVDTYKTPDLSDFYSRGQVDEKLAQFYNRTTVDEKLAAKATKTEVAELKTQLDGAKYPASSVNGYTFAVQTSDPGAGSSLASGKILIVYE